MEAQMIHKSTKIPVTFRRALEDHVLRVDGKIKYCDVELDYDTTITNLRALDIIVATKFCDNSIDNKCDEIRLLYYWMETGKRSFTRGLIGLVSYNGELPVNIILFNNKESKLDEISIIISKLFESIFNDANLRIQYYKLVSTVYDNTDDRSISIVVRDTLTKSTLDVLRNNQDAEGIICLIKAGMGSTEDDVLIMAKKVLVEIGVPSIKPLLELIRIRIPSSDDEPIVINPPLFAFACDTLVDIGDLAIKQLTEALNDYDFRYYQTRELIESVITRISNNNNEGQ
jgi:hypothetical protein